MNLPNKLTVFRIGLVPFFVLFMCCPMIPLQYVWALLLFIIASITDLLDGKIARKRNLITNFGKFLDPLADKILISAALVCFVELDWTYSWVVIIVLTREFAVSGVRLAAASSEEKLVIPANMWGKIKTTITMISVIAILFMHILLSVGALDGTVFPVTILSDILMYLTAAVTLISGIKYIYDYRGFVNPNS